MKKLTLILGSLTLIINILLGMMLSFYPAFNMGVNCVVILFNMVLIYTLSAIQIKDGFRYSLNFLFIALSLVEVILGFLTPERFEDNFTLILLLLILISKIVLLIITACVSKITNLK